LLEAGLEIEFFQRLAPKGEALTIALMDIIVPMVLGFACAWLLPDHYLISPDRKLMLRFFWQTSTENNNQP